MCSWGYIWQSERRDSYQKGIPSWGGMRDSGPLTRPSGEVLAWLLLLNSFQVPIFICLEISLRGGTKSIIVYRLALGMECRVVRNIRSVTQQCDTPSEQSSWYANRGAICALSEAVSGYTASAAPHRSLDWQWWAVPPYFCLISELLPLLTLQLLMPESEHVFCLALTSPARPLITTSMYAKN